MGYLETTHAGATGVEHQELSTIHSASTGQRHSLHAATRTSTPTLFRKNVPAGMWGAEAMTGALQGISSRYPHGQENIGSVGQA